MSKERNEILPGAGVWDSFYDKRVQAVLETRRNLRGFDEEVSEVARLESLAWPIIAFYLTDEMVQDLAHKIRRQVRFLDAYAQDPEFVAPLLAEITKYRFMPPEKMSLTRKIAEVSNQWRPGAIEARFSLEKNPDERPARSPLHDWKEIAAIIGSPFPRFIGPYSVVLHS